MLPASLEPGDYTLSWRWDTELNPQVWLNCADITIIEGPVPPSPIPSPTPRPGPMPSPQHCGVGDSIKCPGSSAMCAGNQCCPDGSTCPSVTLASLAVASPRKEDCT